MYAFMQELITQCHVVISRCIIDSNTCYQVNRYKTPIGDVEGKKILYFDVDSRFYALRKMFV